jgi:hypothetical protein
VEKAFYIRGKETFSEGSAKSLEIFDSEKKVTPEVR